MFPVRGGKSITDRPAEKVEDAKHDHAGGQTGEKAAGEAVRKLREIEPAQVIAHIRRHAANHEGREIERHRAEWSQGKNCGRMR